MLTVSTFETTHTQNCQQNNKIIGHGIFPHVIHDFKIIYCLIIIVFFQQFQSAFCFYFSLLFGKNESIDEMNNKRETE